MNERLKTIGTIVGAGLLGGAAALIFDVGALIAALGFLPGMGLLLLFLALSFFLQIVLHEGGHLATGLWSGYAFSSFRVLSFQLIRRQGRFALKRFHIVGTGGQCLLAPPRPYRPDYPYRFYNLGGGLANLLAAGLAMAAVLSGAPIAPWAGLFLFAFALAGLLSAFANLVPRRIHGLGNDGWNLLHLGRNPEQALLLWRMLEINDRLTQGERLREMPGEWFAWEPTADTDLEDAFVCSKAVYRLGWLMDQERFPEALSLAERILRQRDRMLLIYRMEVTCDLLYLELLGTGAPEGRLARTEALYTPELARYVKATATYPSRCRLDYAMARLFHQDPCKAREALERFEKAAARHPYTGEAEGERALLARVDEAAGGALPATAQECPEK